MTSIEFCKKKYVDLVDFFEDETVPRVPKFGWRWGRGGLLFKGLQLQQLNHTFSSNVLSKAKKISRLPNTDKPTPPVLLTSRD